jgi:hypothetical protein
MGLAVGGDVCLIRKTAEAWFLEANGRMCTIRKMSQDSGDFLVELEPSISDKNRRTFFISPESLVKLSESQEESCQGNG